MTPPLLAHASGCAPTGTTARGQSVPGLVSAVPDWVSRFTRVAMQERHVSPSTIEAYKLDLTMLARWAAERQKDLLTLTTGDLDQYVVTRIAQGTNPSTLARHLSSFRCFYGFLVGQRGLATNPAAGVHVRQLPRRNATLVRDDLLTVMLRPPSRDYPSRAAAYRARRDHAIICMIYGTAIGISDVRLLRWDQIDLGARVGWLSVRNTQQERFVLNASVVAALRNLPRDLAVAGFESATSGYCFPTASGLPMTRQALCHTVRKWTRERGLTEVITPSALRQTGKLNQYGQRRLRPSPAPH